MFSFSSNKNSGGKIEKCSFATPTQQKNQYGGTIEKCSFATQQKQSSSENQLRSFGTSKKW
jgi:hypothetical protein